MVFKQVSLEPFDAIADTVFVEDGWIRAVGYWSQIQNLVDSQTAVIDGAGCSLLPGIDDSHLHGYMVGRRLSGVDVSPGTCPNLEAINDAIRHYSLSHSGWIRGFGWVSGTFIGTGPDSTPHQNDLSVSEVNQPVILTDFSGHQAWCNRSALELAGISRNTEDPVGGVIVRDASGMPTGLLLEAAVRLVTAAMPDPTEAEIRAALLTTRDLLLADGITSFTDPGLGPGATSLDDGSASLAVLDTYRKLAKEGELNLRVNAMLLFGGLGGTTVEQIAEGLEQFGPPEHTDAAELVTVNQLKVFADGIPRSRTAWMSEPYDTHGHGHLTVAGDTDEERVATLESIVGYASSKGWQLGIHATGDESVSAIVGAVEKVPNSADRRHYVIHGDIIKAGDLDRFKRAGLGLNVQPGIRWMVGRNVDRILGRERASRRIQLRQIRAAGVSLCLSSDAPVTAVDWRHIYATATKRDFKGEPGFDDGQSLSPLEAMNGLTLAPAFQTHSETWRGSVTPGKVADLVLMNSKVDWTGSAESISRARPRAVFLGGKLVYGAIA
jgi:predicted amidohydrolase YtcJ